MHVEKLFNTLDNWEREQMLQLCNRWQREENSRLANIRSKNSVILSELTPRVRTALLDYYSNHEVSITDLSNLHSSTMRRIRNLGPKGMLELQNYIENKL
jgi:hypothetical protein